MIAARLEQRGKFNVCEVPDPVCGENDVLIEVATCGVCGTDHHIYTGSAPSALPLIPGHEFSGKVVFCGRKVKRFNIGDRVTVDPNIACGTCRYCRDGNIHYCSNLQAIGVTRNGAFAQYAVAPENQVYSIPDNLDLSLAAFVEPVSCCLHGMDIVSINPGEHIIVFGFGLIGVFMMQLSKLAGAGKIIVVEPSAERRQLAVMKGADMVIDPKQIDLDRELISFHGRPADVILECAGNKDALVNAINAAGIGTRILLFGLAPVSHTIELNLQSFFKKELTLQSSLLNPFTFQRSIDILASGKIDLENLPIEKINLSQDGINSVFEQKRKELSLKTIISPLFH